MTYNSPTAHWKSVTRDSVQINSEIDGKENDCLQNFWIVQGVLDINYSAQIIKNLLRNSTYISPIHDYISTDGIFL